MVQAILIDVLAKSFGRLGSVSVLFVIGERLHGGREGEEEGHLTGYDSFETWYTWTCGLTMSKRSLIDRYAV